MVYGLVTNLSLLPRFSKNNLEINQFDDLMLLTAKEQRRSFRGFDVNSLGYLVCQMVITGPTFYLFTPE